MLIREHPEFAGVRDEVRVVRVSVRRGNVHTVRLSTTCLERAWRVRFGRAPCWGGGRVGDVIWGVGARLS